MEGLDAKCPRPQEILDLSYSNTSDELVKKAHDIWSVTYEQVGSKYNNSKMVRVTAAKQLDSSVSTRVFFRISEYPELFLRVVLSTYLFLGQIKS